MKKHVRILPIFKLKTNKKEKEEKTLKRLKASSPSPKANPFFNIGSLDVLPKLRPISPTFISMPKRGPRVAFTVPVQKISLKILSSPRVKTPNFKALLQE